MTRSPAVCRRYYQTGIGCYGSSVSPFGLKILVQAFLDLLQAPIHGGNPLGHSRITAARAYRVRIFEDALHEAIELGVHLTPTVQSCQRSPIYLIEGT